MVVKNFFATIPFGPQEPPASSTYKSASGDISSYSTVSMSDMSPSFVHMMLARGDAVHRAMHPDAYLDYGACFFCGNVDIYSINPIEQRESKSMLVRFVTCSRCEEIRKAHPDLFAWIWSILHLLYRKPPEPCKPIFTPEEPSEPKKEAPKNILI